MKYNIKTECTFGRKLYDIVLENRGLSKEDIKFLTNPTSEYQELPFKLRNMDKAIELFMRELDDESNIGILVDADCDGFTSSALMYTFLINECQVPKDKIKVFFHEGKLHGLDPKVFKKIKKSNVNFLIIPDASTNDSKEVKELLSIGKRILILDHHQSNDENLHTIYKDTNGKLVGVVVNNQLDEYSTSLSACGVVYKFLVGMTEDELVHYLDLVAVGNIADIMNIQDKELRYLVHKGLRNIHNQFFKEALKEFDLDDLTPEIISFNLSNIINAVTRFGTVDENRDLFRAMVGEEEMVVYKPRKSKNNPEGKEVGQTLQEAMVRISKSIKQKQDNKKKDCIKLCKKYIEENNLNDSKVITIIDEEGKLVDKRITGLIATNLVDTYKKPVVLLSVSTKKDRITGSMRTYGIEDFKSILESTEILTVKGHKGSAGIEAEYKDIRRIKKRIDRAMEDVEVLETGIDIDCEVDENIRLKDMEEIYNLKMIWNSYCPKPLFLIKDVEIDTAKVRVPYPTLMVFKIGDIECKKEFCSKVFRETFLHEGEQKFGRPKIKADLIVEIGWDEYKKKPCFLLKYAESEIIKKEDKKNDIPF